MDEKTKDDLVQKIAPYMFVKFKLHLVPQDVIDDVARTIIDFVLEKEHAQMDNDAQKRPE